jgi:hypothetical protein
MQLKAKALVCGQRSGLNPRGKKIRGGRLDRNVVADTRVIDVGLTVKHQPQGTIAGVLLVSIDSRLHTADALRKKPGKSAAGNT